MSETKKALLKSMEKKNSQASVKNDFNSDNPLDNQKANKEQSEEKKELNNDNKQIEIYDECNGCFQPLGCNYCLVCEKNFCQECDIQAHILPAYAKHERVPLSQMTHFKIVCVHHKLPLKYYCESCSDPVCTECFEKGSHSNKLHKITNVIDSFRKKYSFLQNLVNNHLNQKTEQLVDQIQVIEKTSEEVRNNKLEIEREIKREYVKMLENLKNEEGKKLSVLQYESSVLQREIERINDFSKYFTELGQGTPDMINFLLNYKKISDNIENSLAKPIKKNIDVKVDDLPNEVLDKNNKLFKYEKIKKLVHVKDDIIWKIITDKKERHDEEMILKDEKHQNEINELNKVIEKLCLDLKKYELVCHFCSVKLEENTINTGCHRNVPESSSRIYNTGVMKEYYTTSIIPIELVGNKRHFFGYPNRPIQNINNNNVNSSNGFLQFSTNFASPKKELNNSGLLQSHRNNKVVKEEVNMNSVLEKMKSSAINKQNTVVGLFKLAFKESDIVSFDNIKSFLKKTFSLDENEITKFLSSFKTNNYLNSSIPVSIAHNVSYQMNEILNFLKGKQLDNNYQESKINSFRDSGLVQAGLSILNIERISEWVHKVALLIEENQINLFSVLCGEDKDLDGFISTDDLRICFIKLKLNLNTNDIETMLNYFGLESEEKVKIEEFSRNFMAHLNVTVNI